MRNSLKARGNIRRQLICVSPVFEPQRDSLTLAAEFFFCYSSAHSRIAKWVDDRDVLREVFYVSVRIKVKVVDAISEFQAKFFEVSNYVKFSLLRIYRMLEISES